MKLWYSPYELYPLGSIHRFRKAIRHGILIKFQNKNIKSGYSDCHPLMEFGDPSVSVLIKKLKSDPSHFLIQRSIGFAKIDGQAREERKSLFLRRRIRSHYTCADIEKLTPKKMEKLAENGFKSLKIKIGKDVKRESMALNRLPTDLRQLFRWRFDANGKDGDVFLKQLHSSFYDLVDFIEDPVPFDKEVWTKIEHQFGIRCAFDSPPDGDKKTSFRGVRIIKPAREFLSPRQKDIITNSMDHPVGQSFAFWMAQKTCAKFRDQTQDFGLQTTHLFKTNSFFKWIQTDSAYFKHSDGYGVGFDSLLEKISWQAV